MIRKIGQNIAGGWMSPGFPFQNTSKSRKNAEERPSGDNLPVFDVNRRQKRCFLVLNTEKSAKKSPPAPLFLENPPIRRVFLVFTISKNHRRSTRSTSIRKVNPISRSISHTASGIPPRAAPQNATPPQKKKIHEHKDPLYALPPGVQGGLGRPFSGGFLRFSRCYSLLTV